MRRRRGPADRSQGWPGGRGLVAVAGLAALVIGVPRRRAAARAAGTNGDLGHRLDDLVRRVERLEEWSARSEEHLSARVTALDERQARTEAFATDLQRVILAVSAQVNGAGDRRASDALAERLAVLEREVAKLRDETERAGALAATAVAAGDEVAIVVASLRDLREDLLQLARHTR